MINTKEEVSIPQWVNAPFLDWSDVIDEETDDPDYCFLCCYRQCLHAEEFDTNHAYTSLKLMMTEHLGLAEPKVLTKQIQSMYNTLIRYQIQGYGYGKVWRCETIMAHMELHDPSPHMIRECAVRTIWESIQTIRNGGLRQVNVATGEKIINPIQAKMYIALAKELLILIRKVEGDRLHNVN
jgi:hypothetical protein